jgi:ParB-like chromosome segregation protein Spo0J
MVRRLPAPPTRIPRIRGATLTGEVTTVTTETTTNDPVTLPGAPVQVVEYDPATLLVDVNVRHDVRLDKVFVASIEENGVLSPVVAVRTRDGDIRVRLGHRRVLAALEVGRRVPVAVVGDESGDDADQIERLVAQFAENEHRLSLTTAERVDVVEQLSLLGVPAAQIVKRTRIPRKQVASALAVAGSELAKGAAARHEFLTLDQAAAVAEFDQDTEAVNALLAAAKTGQFAHIVQRLRDERDEAQARSAAEADLAASGVRVVERSGVAAPQVQPRCVVFHTDAAPSVGKIPVDVEALDIDLLTLVGHKMYAPKGIAALDGPPVPAAGSPAPAARRCPARTRTRQRRHEEATAARAERQHRRDRRPRAPGVMPHDRGVAQRRQGRRRARRIRARRRAHRAARAGVVRRLARELPPGARFRRRLLWRYSLVWTKPAPS